MLSAKLKRLCIYARYGRTTRVRIIFPIPRDRYQLLTRLIADTPDGCLCGDVGYGKTEVAIRAAFKAIMDENKLVILVPTTILARQHYETIRERFQDYPINIGLLSRFRNEETTK